MPRAATLVSGAADVERENFPPCKVVLEELVVGDAGIVHGAAGTGLPVRSGDVWGV